MRDLKREAAFLGVETSECSVRGFALAIEACIRDPELFAELDLA